MIIFLPVSFYMCKLRNKKINFCSHSYLKVFMINFVYRSESDLADRKADAGKPPHNITAIAGSTHVAINRDFVNFTLNDQRAIDFIEWLKKTYFPDEFIFSSFNHNPHLGIPGTFLGKYMQ